MPKMWHGVTEQQYHETINVQPWCEDATQSTLYDNGEDLHRPYEHTRRVQALRKRVPQQDLRCLISSQAWVIGYHGEVYLKVEGLIFQAACVSRMC